MVFTGWFDGTGILSSGVADIVIQPDGKIVAVGDRWDTQNGFLLVRYNPDGSLDTSFDGDGIVTTPLGPNAGARSVVLQPDGKIVASGVSSNGFTVIRYNGNGSLDSSFGTGGTVATLAAQAVKVNSSALQPDGKIIVAGSRYNVSNEYYPEEFALLRFN